MLKPARFGVLVAAAALGIGSGFAARGPDGWIWLFALLLASAGLVAVLQQTLA